MLVVNTQSLSTVKLRYVVRSMCELSVKLLLHAILLSLTAPENHKQKETIQISTLARQRR